MTAVEALGPPPGPRVLFAWVCLELVGCRILDEVRL